VGWKIGGFEDHPDWPKMGPSLLIATCLIVAIRTAKWTARSESSTASDFDLEREIEHAAHVADRVLSHHFPDAFNFSECEEALVSAGRGG